MSQEFSLFATCPRYMEQLLADELVAMGVEQVKLGIGGVYFDATQKRAYRVCLWSRLANRVLLQLVTVRVDSKDDVYAAASSVNWREHIAASRDGKSSIAVDFNGSSESIRNTHFGSQLIKDAVVDQFSSSDRPSVDKQAPDLRINAHLAKGTISIAVDLSGQSLHRRAYRAGTGEAPMKENLAAAILIRAGWPSVCERSAQSDQKAVLLDPMCGSGTLLFEAALMAYDCAPGLLRESWGFSGWKRHDPEAWASILSEAEQRLRAAEVEPRALLIGYDKDKAILGAAHKTAKRLGLEQHFVFSNRSIAQLTCPAEAGDTRGLVISNPPYGERIGEVRELENLYSTFGGHLKQYFAGWDVAVYSSNTELLDELRLRSAKKYRLRNGPLEGQLRLFTIAENEAPVADEDFKTAEVNSEAVASKDNEIAREPLRLGQAKVVEELANRLRKNKKKLQKAQSKIDSNCYRLYDADLPEYSSAIDIYADYVLVTEYTAPDTIDEKKASQRIQNTLLTVETVLELDSAKVIYKTKRRQKGSDQYQRSGRDSELLEVKEGQARFLVNLHDYHDTGLFLDHRPVRRYLAERAKGKRFLNLFCYTAAATVQVALAGAKETTSIDMSAPYLVWARKNMKLNKASPYGHHFLQEDCLQWLAGGERKFHKGGSADDQQESGGEKPRDEAAREYDLILLDPPSFSNSKRMDETLDVQRDHAEMITQCMKLLSDNGELVFSTNRRKFKLDPELSENFQVADITKRTLDPDFQRIAPAHRCWSIQHS
ncbi:MAG: bifunctional 23S rRNA (guanine(2069)-N(7))-methyltransferase RlmK/23S rRNA (guanine(2445)-N(2))-methyltransferase RlmL [Pseudomonadales bacterium]